MPPNPVITIPLLDRRCSADGLEGEVGTTTGGNDCTGRDRLVARAVHDVGGAVRCGELELRVVEVDRDDAGGVGEARGLGDRPPDAAAAEHRDGLAGGDAGRGEGGADAGQDAAAEEAAGRAGATVDPADGDGSPARAPRTPRVATNWWTARCRR